MCITQPCAWGALDAMLCPSQVPNCVRTLLLLLLWRAGIKFYLPLDQLVAAVCAGMTYTPVTRADLAKGVPVQGWNTLP